MSPLIERVRAALGAEYEVERELAAGGMGVVFLGRERALERAVAIKILRPEQATAIAAERFQREAKLLAAVTHPNVVTIHRVGEAGGLFFLVMERLEAPWPTASAAAPCPPATSCGWRVTCSKAWHGFTIGESCIATSSRPTSSCATTAGPCSAISASLAVWPVGMD
jgi:hypothetical protein